MTEYKVLVTARSFGSGGDRAEKLLKEHGCQVKKVLAAELISQIGDADAVIAGLEPYDRRLMEAAPGLKVISRYGVGYDRVDMKAAADCGVRVTITPGANGESVADMAVALMLDCARNITVMNHSIKEKNSIRISGVEMYEKTLGVVGTGRIGRGVARRCAGFAMRVLGYDTYQGEGFPGEYVDLQTLLRESDFITLHLPLTEKTNNLIGSREFDMMKKNAIIVNTARGGIIDETALYEALSKGKIRAAGLDATVKEPPYDSELLTLQNCIITPHAGAATLEAADKMGYLAACNVLDILERGRCKYEVKE